MPNGKIQAANLTVNILFGNVTSAVIYISHASFLISAGKFVLVFALLRLLRLFFSLKVFLK